MRRYLKILLAVYICCVVIWLCLPTSENRRSSLGPTTPVPNPIVGAWKGEHGVVIQMRPDGTIRSRFLDDASNTIRYSGYRQEGDQLFVDYIAKPDEYWRRVRQAISGTNHEQFRVVTLTDDKLELFDIVSSKQLSFSRIEDKLLSEAE